jgi:hypothetical protein
MIQPSTFWMMSNAADEQRDEHHLQNLALGERGEQVGRHDRLDERPPVALCPAGDVGDRVVRRSHGHARTQVADRADRDADQHGDQRGDREPQQRPAAQPRGRARAAEPAQARDAHHDDGELHEADEDLADAGQRGREPGHVGLFGDEAEQCAEQEPGEHGEAEHGVATGSWPRFGLRFGCGHRKLPAVAV